MFDPTSWKKDGHGAIVNADGHLIAERLSDGDADLARCAPDMYQFIHDLVAAGSLNDDVHADAERLLRRAEGFGR